MRSMHLKSPALVNKMLIAFALASSSLSLSGCVSTKIQSQGVGEARTTVLKEANSIAIFPFDGDIKEEPAATLEHALTDANTRGLTRIRLVDRRSTDTIRGELKINSDGGIDKKSAKKQGDFLGAEYLLLGRVLPATVSSKKSTHQEATCESYEESKKFFKKCKQSKPVNVTCTITTVKVKVQPRLVRVSNGEVIYAKMHEGVVEDSYCENTGVATAEAVLKAHATIQAAVEISRDLWPFVYVISTTIKPSSEGLSGQAKEKFDSAVAFARAGRMDRFCQTMQSLNQENFNTVSTAYNYAICEEADNKIIHARDILEELDKSLNYPDKDISEALIRLRNLTSAAVPNQSSRAKL
ncbi:curli production assembly/transport component CsgG [Azospirillum baldaniorum]|uniref:CsgG/HfaB family protein n=1 Tax=Azospirillum baldaniorum TaxID=1064539 RepID=UPI0011A6F7AF|nr:CsgG/HfaB family protein [Azospirillum baldaniorum]TWA59579.1 curli production assembly/transport component CsgG [Azospirillum baldaniorum]